MTNRELQCPMCCKHKVVVSEDILENGGVVPCKCGYKIKLAGRRSLISKTPVKKKRSNHDR